jgi:hypothetical protein
LAADALVQVGHHMNKNKDGPSHGLPVFKGRAVDGLDWRARENDDDIVYLCYASNRAR